MNVGSKGFGSVWLAVFLILLCTLVGCPKQEDIVSESETEGVGEPTDMEEAEIEKERELEEAEARRLEEERAKEFEAEQARLLEEEKLKFKAEFENVDIQFEYDRFTLTTTAREILRQKYDYLQNHPELDLLIEGHCDERGTIEYNVALGDRRAKSARDYLVRLGVRSSRIETISYGEEMPLDREHNEMAWARNRRAKFVIIGED